MLGVYTPQLLSPHQFLHTFQTGRFLIEAE